MEHTIPLSEHSLPINGAGSQLPAAPAADQPQDLISKSMATFLQGGAILVKNQQRVVKAEAWADEILENAELLGGKLNAELDKDADEFLSSAARAAKEMEDERKPVTQIMGLVLSQFTAAENALKPATAGSKAARIQGLRNKYAADLREKERLEEEQRKRDAAKAVEAAALATKAGLSLLTHFTTYLNDLKATMRGNFDAITLETFDTASANLECYAPAYPYEHFQEWKCYAAAALHTAEEVEAFAIEARKGAFGRFGSQFANEISALTEELITRLPGKLAELQQLATAGEEERLRLEAEADQRRKDEEERQRQDDQRKADDAAQGLQLAGSIAHTEALFSGTSRAGMSGGVKPKSKTTWDIEVLSPVGWTLLFTLWFEKEGASLDAASGERKTLGQIRKYCADLATSGGARIESKALRYFEATKAVTTRTTKK